MSASPSSNRRTTVQITMGRAARIHRLARLLIEAPCRRDNLLTQLKVGLRTFYRELELLKKVGLKVKRDGKTYSLGGTLAQAEVRLPFPDPKLSFSEMAELSRLPGPTPGRLAALLESVVNPPEASKARSRRSKRDR